MKAIVPRRFEDLGNLDVEAVNDNLEAIAADVTRNLSRRYTYSTLVFDLDGISNTDPQAQRQFIVRSPVATHRAEVVGVELVVYSTVAWTVTGAVGWPGFTVTGVDATTEASGSSNVPVSVGVSGVSFYVAGAAAGTITRGYLVVHLRCDRGNQGTSHAGYTPALLNSLSSTAGSVLDTELQAAEAAVQRDAVNDLDLRCEVVRVRNLGAGSSRTWRLPSGGRRKAACYLLAAADGACTVTLTIDGTPEVSFAGTGVGTLYATGGALSGTLNDDPMDSADDTVVTLSAAGATAVILYALIWWS